MSRAADIRLPSASAGGKMRLGPNDLIEAQRPFVDEFWTEVFGTSYSTSFVSNDGTLGSWEHYVGARDDLIVRVQDVYGVDVTDVYMKPMHAVLAFVCERATRSRSAISAIPSVVFVGFENDGGLSVLLRQLGLYDDYKGILPKILLQYFREDFPTTVVNTIELLDEPDCKVSGITDDEGVLAEVQDVAATLSLRVTVHVDGSGYLLDVGIVMRISDIGSMDRKDFYVTIAKQVSLR